MKVTLTAFNATNLPSQRPAARPELWHVGVTATMTASALCTQETYRSPT
ncbi:hypothetical protein [Kibdelosporangium philippinense]